MSLELYKVTRKNIMACGCCVAHGISYVLASNPTDAYKKTQIDLEERELGFVKNKGFVRIESLDENVEYPFCGTRAYIQEK